MKTLRLFLFMTLLTGLLYPMLVTLIAELAMKQKASGGFIEANGKIVGSTLIAQEFKTDKYFWPRPSAIHYQPLPSGGSNLGPTSATLKKTIEERRKKIGGTNIPSELLFASGSGLDPHISPSTAYFQIERVAGARGLNPKELKELIDRHTIPPRFGFLGPPCLNVLLLNRDLDEPRR